MRISEIADAIIKLRTFEVHWSMKGAKKGGGSFTVDAIDETGAKRLAKKIMGDRYARHEVGKQWQIASISDSKQEHDVTIPKTVTAKPPITKPVSVKKAIRDLGLQYADESVT